jgi:hypothetical protein
MESRSRRQQPDRSAGALKQAGKVAPLPAGNEARVRKTADVELHQQFRSCRLPLASFDVA